MYPERLDKLAERIAELKGVLGDLVVWTARDGQHVSTWFGFQSFLYAACGERGEMPAVCPLLAFDMDQIFALPEARQLAMSIALVKAGFPAMEQDGRGIWVNRRGLVTLDD